MEKSIKEGQGPIRTVEASGERERERERERKVKLSLCFN
jgi:hypothetical protein